jgi:hypothetical protein
MHITAIVPLQGVPAKQSIKVDRAKRGEDLPAALPWLISNLRRHILSANVSAPESEAGAAS